jgi:hypothetical protein
LIENGGVTHNFESGPSKDHFNSNFKAKDFAGMVVGWSLFNFVFDSAALHSKWLLLPKIDISLVVKKI